MMLKETCTVFHTKYGGATYTQISLKYGTSAFCNSENWINQKLKHSMNYKKKNCVSGIKLNKNESAEFKITTNSRLIDTSRVVK